MEGKITGCKEDRYDYDHEDHDDDDVTLPGFRFHPTDEELVGFYLRRKIQNKPSSLELIKSIDIYKHDPWDLPKATTTAGDKEWYFFCRRGRKYKNSIRPNRVTGSGFWKATGIDKPVHDSGHVNCIGLKKTLVYYRGSTGKGTKTDWMMHEFRRPSPNDVITNGNAIVSQKNANLPQEAEIWTLCRIFKRNVSHKKYTPDWRDLSTKLNSKRSNMTIDHQDRNNQVIPNGEAYISFGVSNICYEEEKKPNVLNHVTKYNNANHIIDNQTFHNASHHQFIMNGTTMTTTTTPTHAYSTDPFATSYSYTDIENHDFFNENWEEFRSVIQLALDPSFMQ